MADYYTILKKTISGMAQNSQVSRDAVYGKARTAIDRQLRAMNPAPSEEAISRQMAMLEAAIVKLDGEFGASPTEARSDVLDVQTSGVQPPEAGSPNNIAPPMPAEPSPGYAAPVPPVPPTTPAPSAPAPAAPSTAPVPVVEAHAGYVPAGSGEGGHNPLPDPLSDPVSERAFTDPGSPGASVTDPQGMDYSETIFAQNPDTQPVPAEGKSKKKKGGILSSLLPIVLAIAVIGGGVYALWINKDALINGLTGGETPVASTDEPGAENANNETVVETANNENVPVSPQPARQVRVVGENNEEKSSVKLTTEGQTVVVEPIVVPTVSIPIQPDAENSVVPQPATEPVAETLPTANEEAKEEQEPVVIAQNNETQPVSTAPAVAQKAFLYEEGSSGANASRDNAAIIWSLGSEDVGGVSEAVIKGKLDVPGRNLSMSLEIKRNRDESLPASHIIELVFSLPGDFSGGNISNVSRFVMKTSEQDRGSGLIAVPAKISDGNFLIALNNLDQALATNRRLLLQSSWIDVPLGYTTGRRALVTLEKGALGNKIFKEAFADWDSR